MTKIVKLSVTVEVVDPELLVNYTSGFMAEDTPITARVQEVICGDHPHPRLADINGIRIMDVALTESRG